MTKLRVAAATILGIVGAAGAAYAADMDTMVTKAPPPPAITAPASCGSLYDFFVTACPLTWNGVTLYGTVDMGGTYQTHGSPFDPNFPTGASYLLGAGGGNATNRAAGFGWAPNGMSQSNVGIKVIEPIAPGGWSFISQNEIAFDPYSLLLSNAPQAMQNGIGVAENLQAQPYDSSRWGWLAATNVVGLSQPVFGTLTFGRQNSLLNDSLSAYDPMGASYAFAMIGYSGKYAGAGGTEEARWTTGIKYRVNVGDFRFAVMGQPIGGADGGYNTYNPNNGAVAGQIGSRLQALRPRDLLVGCRRHLGERRGQYRDDIPRPNLSQWLSGWGKPVPQWPRRQRPQGDDLQQHERRGVGQIQLRFLGKHPAAGRGQSTSCAVRTLRHPAHAVRRL